MNRGRTHRRRPTRTFSLRTRSTSKLAQRRERPAPCLATTGDMSPLHSVCMTQRTWNLIKNYNN